MNRYRFLQALFAGSLSFSASADPTPKAKLPVKAVPATPVPTRHLVGLSPEGFVIQDQAGKILLLKADGSQIAKRADLLLGQMTCRVRRREKAVVFW